MTTPDHDPEVFTLSCPANVRLKPKRNANEMIQASFVMLAPFATNHPPKGRGLYWIFAYDITANNSTLILAEHICQRVTRLFPNLKKSFFARNTRSCSGIWFVGEHSFHVRMCCQRDF